MPKMRLPKSSFTGKQAETPSVADFAGMGEIALLPKAKVLENLLNHVEDLKGTPFEQAAEFLAEKAPWVFGHIEEVLPNMNKLPGRAKLLHGAQVGKPGQMTGGKVYLNPDKLNTGFRTSAPDVLGHEAGHAAQQLGKGGSDKFNELYQASPTLFEAGASKAGANLRKFVETGSKRRQK